MTHRLRCFADATPGMETEHEETRERPAKNSGIETDAAASRERMTQLCEACERENSSKIDHYVKTLSYSSIMQQRWQQQGGTIMYAVQANHMTSEAKNYTS